MQISYTAIMHNGLCSKTVGTFSELISISLMCLIVYGRSSHALGAPLLSFPNVEAATAGGGTAAEREERRPLPSRMRAHARSRRDSGAAAPLPGRSAACAMMTSAPAAALGFLRRQLSPISGSVVHRLPLHAPPQQDLPRWACSP